MTTEQEKIAVEQIKRQEDVQRALKQTATTREEIKPPVETKHKIWLGTYLLLLVGLAGLYYLFRLEFFGFAAKYVPLLKRFKNCEARVSALKELESIKWYLWHGNVFEALEQIGYMEMEADGEIITGACADKLRKSLDEFHTYIERNPAMIPNYGERWRSGEAISSAFVESAVNQVISKRMVKKQQMRWSKRGAHLRLQVRTKVLND